MLSTAFEVVVFGSPVDALPFLPVQPPWLPLLRRLFTRNTPTLPAVPPPSSTAAQDPDEVPADPPVGRGPLDPWHAEPPWSSATAPRKLPAETPVGRGPLPPAHKAYLGRSSWELLQGLHGLPQCAVGPLLLGALSWGAPPPWVLLRALAPWHAALPLAAAAPRDPPAETPAGRGPSPPPDDSWELLSVIHGLPQCAVGPLLRAVAPWHSVPPLSSAPRELPA